uniref:Rho-GAP domain-containing protein n=1 Tax=Ditylenchus dipsaci TaxID=166011 RepID=A0A915DMV1_9BILA
MQQSDDEAQRQVFCRVICSLSVPSQHLLVLLFGTFRIITDSAETFATRMTPDAVGISVAPSLFHTCIHDGQRAKLEDVMRFKMASQVISKIIQGFGYTNLFPRECYEFYARITGRTLRVDEHWHFTFQYPSNATRSNSSPISTSPSKLLSNLIRKKSSSSTISSMLSSLQTACAAAPCPTIAPPHQSSIQRATSLKHTVYSTKIGPSRRSSATLPTGVNNPSRVVIKVGVSDPGLVISESPKAQARTYRAGEQENMCSNAFTLTYSTTTKGSLKSGPPEERPPPPPPEHQNNAEAFWKNSSFSSSSRRQKLYMAPSLTGELTMEGCSSNRTTHYPTLSLQRRINAYCAAANIPKPIGAVNLKPIVLAEKPQEMLGTRLSSSSSSSSSYYEDEDEVRADLKTRYEDEVRGSKITSTRTKTKVRAKTHRTRKDEDEDEYERFKKGPLASRQLDAAPKVPNQPPPGQRPKPQLLHRKSVRMRIQGVRSGPQSHSLDDPVGGHILSQRLSTSMGEVVVHSEDEGEISSSASTRAGHSRGQYLESTRSLSYLEWVHEKQTRRMHSRSEWFLSHQLCL